MLHISVEKGAVGAGSGATMHYGSGSTKMMRLLWALE
jgi:L-aminopeptidase/D-esterase-like protein